MSGWRFILRSLRHYRRIHVAVILGVAVATAALTGALLVGDSVRGSLRGLTLQRLGRIDSALVTGHLFRAALADELAAGPAFQENFAAAEPAMLLRATLQSGTGQAMRRATHVDVVGCRENFWSLGQGGPAEPLGRNEVALTEPLAAELGVADGDEIQLRVPTATAIPADSPLGKKEDTSRLARFRVAAVLPARGLARFALLPSQHAPRSAFVRLDDLADLFEKPGGANAILVAARQADRPAGEAAEEALRAAFHPQLEDYGLKLERLESPTPAFQIAADQLVLPDAVVRATERAFSSDALQPVVTYLANTICVGQGDDRRKIPYSTITGVDSTTALGPLLDGDGQPIRLADHEIVLNRWAADDLEAKVGDLVTVTFYEPESTHGRLRERQPPATFVLRAIVDLEGADGRPTPAADPKLTPELPGVTDQKTIADWDLPFELVEKIRPQDEEYWDKYRTTPKAFVSLSTAKQLWGSRWGTISLVRLPAGEFLRNSQSDQSFGDRLLEALRPADVGMVFLPVKAQGLAAASGTTPFDGLFLGFSFFLIAAAVMLIAILFQLGVQQRAGELGTLAVVGIGRKRISRLLSWEGLLVAAVGAVLGVAAGILYAALMVFGLCNWWVAALATPFLELHVTPRSLILGALIGVAVSWLTIRWSIRRLVRVPASRLLHGVVTGEPRRPAARASDGRRRGPRAWPVTRVALLALIVALAVAGFKLAGEARAGAFFGSGAVVLALLLGEIRHRFQAPIHSAGAHRRFSLPALSALNTARNPGRSTLTIGLVAAATFLIVAVSAFRLETGEGGTGRFALVATSDRPIHFDLNDPQARELELGFTSKSSDELNDWQIYSLRVAEGEDASCLNLYRPTQPRVLGVPDALVDRGGFEWSDAAVDPAEDVAVDYPWTLLRANFGRDDAGRPIVPVVLDASTAIYSLHLDGVGARFSIRDASDRPVTLQVVGLLANSVLQGNLLMSEANYLQLFPDTSGYRFFLIDNVSSHASEASATSVAGTRGDATPRPSAQEIAQLLETTLAADGFDAVDAREQLAGFLAVQNTYLSTFQSLGALGLLLGTVGLAVVQLRSVLERRGELALMRAQGFRRRRLVRMILWENAVLLVGGLAVGLAAAAVALVPQWAPHEASVPWATLVALLAVIAVIGLAAGWLATRSALRAPLVPALRGE